MAPWPRLAQNCAEEEVLGNAVPASLSRQGTDPAHLGRSKFRIAHGLCCPSDLHFTWFKRPSFPLMAETTQMHGQLIVETKAKKKKSTKRKKGKKILLFLPLSKCDGPECCLAPPVKFEAPSDYWKQFRIDSGSPGFVMNSIDGLIQVVLILFYFILFYGFLSTVPLQSKRF